MGRRTEIPPHIADLSDVELGSRLAALYAQIAVHEAEAVRRFKANGPMALLTADGKPHLWIDDRQPVYTVLDEEELLSILGDMSQQPDAAVEIITGLLHTISSLKLQSAVKNIGQVNPDLQTAINHRLTESESGGLAEHFGTARAAVRKSPFNAEKHVLPSVAPPTIDGEPLDTDDESLTPGN